MKKQKITNTYKAVVASLKTTINRFRENPMYYFTESDIHTALKSDLLANKSHIFYKRHRGIPISRVHHEYPANFRHEKSKLLEGYANLDKPFDINHETSMFNQIRGRGHYDLTILSSDFIQNMFSTKNSMDALRHIVNKDIDLPKERYRSNSNSFFKELEYAIEVKYIHAFNVKYNNMINEIIKDNEKLRLAYYHSKHNVKPINLIFCSTKKETDNVIKRIEGYIRDGKPQKTPRKILNIIIKAYYVDGEKSTPLPKAYCTSPSPWVIKFCKDLGYKLN